MLYVKSMLKEEIELEIIDANLEKLEFDTLRERIKDSKADVMIFNTTINYILWRCPPVDFEIPLMLMDCCKDLNITTIAIGPHTSVVPKEVYHKLGVDYLINGEPEIALADFLNSDLKDFRITFRKKTVSQMEEEILAVKNAGIGYIYFIDEIFNQRF